LLIGSVAAAPGLRLWAGAPSEIPDVYKLILVAGGFALLGVGLLLGLRRLLGERRVAAFVTFFALLALTSGGQLLPGRGWSVRWLVALLAVAVAVAIVFRLRSWWLLDAIVFGCALALLIPPALEGARHIWLARQEPEPTATSPPMPVMQQEPDIVLVIVDGYTGLPVLRELFGYADSELHEDLSDRGFAVIDRAFTPYPMTHLTLSSLLELDYVAKDQPSTSTADGRTLPQVIGGESYLVRLLAANGYRITMVESGWHMSACGTIVDDCVHAPFIDEAVGVILAQSLFWSFFEPSIGSAFTLGSKQAMTWATGNLNRIVNNEESDFVFVHVLAPHPPLFLDAECQVAQGEQRQLGETVSLVGVDTETARARVAGYVNQVRCVDRFIREIAGEVEGSDSLVVIAGDHGSDSMSQLVSDPENWSDPQVLERMSVFLAVKPTDGCENPASLVTLTLLRNLVSCAGDLGLDPVEDRSFLVSLTSGTAGVPMRRLDADDLQRFSRCLEEIDAELRC
jgi:hypothetical protein